MTTCKLRVTVEDELAKPKPVIDRCTDHGLWFDRDELAAVLEKVRRKVSPKHGAFGWPGSQKGPAWWRGGSM
jgi:hypothetical protein